MGSEDRDIMCAFTIPCVIAASADGEFTEAKKSQLYECLRTFPLFSSVHLQQHRTIIAEAVKQVYADGVPTSLDKAGQILNGQLRESAFAWSYELALCDGEETPDTSAMVDTIIQRFEIPEETVLAVKRSLFYRLLIPTIHFNSGAKS